jgi:hypothetical protein
VDKLNERTAHLEGCVALMTGWELIWYQVEQIREREAADYRRRIIEGRDLTTIQARRSLGYDY